MTKKELIVCRVDELPAGHVRTVRHDDKEFAVYNVAGAYYAMDNICPHRGAPLCDGRNDGPVVTCPWHGWQFDVTQGTLLMDPSTRLATAPVRVRGENIVLEIP